MRAEKIGTKEIATAAVLLAICIISQFFKNLSIFITGPIVNTCLILCVLTAGLAAALALAVITPVTAFFISGSPVMMAVPAMIPFIMAGNAVLVICFYFLLNREMRRADNPVKNPVNIGKAVLCAAAKGIFMGLTISLWLLPAFLPAQSPLRGKLGVLQTTFSLHQFLTACIGFVYVFIIWAVLKKVFYLGENA